MRRISDLRAPLSGGQSMVRTVPESGEFAAAQVEAAGLSDRGLERERNEDAFLIATLVRSLSVQGTNLPQEVLSYLRAGMSGTLLAVADGMGGYAGGDIASRVALGAMADYVLSVMPWVGRHAVTSAPREGSFPGIRESLDQALHVSDARVKDEAVRTRHPQMGTTLTLAYLVWPRLYLAHVGDSRCYLLRGVVAHQLSKDHTFASQLAEYGAVPAETEAELKNLLWNAIGAPSELKPQVDRFALQPNDLIVLCTDGLTKHVSNDELCRVVLASPSPREACAELIRLANADGGTDNITVIVARPLTVPA